MKLFALIAFLNGQAYVLDTNQTGADCIAAIESGIARVTIAEGVTVPADGATFACEMESR